MPAVMEAAAMLAARLLRRLPRPDAKDVREFLMAYCACFLAVSALIA